ncbi:MAG: YbjQ family protein [Planctomycetota bacterium]|nr:MAG: YbjQ family protein [Planctomycetota bacterium]
MIITTTDTVPGREAVEILGVVRGTTVRARFLFSNISAMLRYFTGGEVPEYTKVIAEAREQAMDRMRDQAVALSADAVLNIRFSSSEVMSGAAEVICYGTAVRLGPAASTKPSTKSDSE